MRTTMHFYGSKEDEYFKGERILKLKGPALDKFANSLLQVVLEVDVDLTSGETTVVSVNGNPVSKKDE